MNDQFGMDLTLYVTCDDHREKIELIKRGSNELPQKFYVAYVDKIRGELDGESLPTDPAAAYIYETKDAYLRNERPLRPVVLTDNVGQNGLKGETSEPMLLAFISRSVAA